MTMSIRFTWAGFLIGYLILSGLIVVVRGIAGSTRTYGLTEVLLTPIEIGFLIWVVGEVSE